MVALTMNKSDSTSSNIDEGSAAVDKTVGVQPFQYLENCFNKLKVLVLLQQQENQNNNTEQPGNGSEVTTDQSQPTTYENEVSTNESGVTANESEDTTKTTLSDNTTDVKNSAVSEESIRNDSIPENNANPIPSSAPTSRRTSQIDNPYINRNRRHSSYAAPEDNDLKKLRRQALLEDAEKKRNVLNSRKSGKRT